MPLSLLKRATCFKVDNMEIYRDPSKIIEDRVRDLLGRMEVEEKLAQMGSLFAPPLMTVTVAGEQFSEEKAIALIPHGIGHISAAGRSSGLAPEKLASFNNAVQRFLKEHTRLGIPAIVSGLKGLRFSLRTSAWPAPGSLI
jgi:beta-glucosidase